MKTVLLAAVAALALTGPVSAQTVTECDRLAAHGSDPERVADGVSSSGMDKPAAIEACKQAVEDDPDNRRLIYQLGRAYSYTGNWEDGLPLVKQAADMGHQQSQFVYGYVKAYGLDGNPADLCEAESYWAMSAEQGRRAAQISYPRMAAKGLFDGCGPLASIATMQGWLTDVESKMGGYYETLLYEDVAEDFAAYAAGQN